MPVALLKLLVIGAAAVRSAARKGTGPAGVALGFLATGLVLHTAPDRLRGVAVLGPNDGDEVLAELDAAGVRARPGRPVWASTTPRA